MIVNRSRPLRQERANSVCGCSRAPLSGETLGMVAFRAVVVAVLVVLATTGSASAGLRTSPTACSLITTGEAKHILHAPVTSTRGVGQTSCSFTFRVRGTHRLGWLVPNVNPNQKGTLCCSAQGALRRFKGYGARITMVPSLGRAAFAAALRLPNGSVYEQIVAVRHGRLLVLQGDRASVSLAEMVALAFVAYERL